MCALIFAVANWSRNSLLVVIGCVPSGRVWGKSIPTASMSLTICMMHTRDMNFGAEYSDSPDSSADFGTVFSLFSLGDMMPTAALLEKFRAAGAFGVNVASPYWVPSAESDAEPSRLSALLSARYVSTPAGCCCCDVPLPGRTTWIKSWKTRAKSVKCNHSAAHACFQSKDGYVCAHQGSVTW